MKNKLIHILILLSLMLSACSTSPVAEEIAEETVIPVEDTSVSIVVDDPAPATEASTEETDVSRHANWHEETHSNDVDPNYDVVFPKDEVNQITITVSPDNWAAMQANMAELFGNSDTSDQRAGGIAAGGQPTVGEGAGQPPARGGGGGGGQPAMGERPEGEMQPPAAGERPEMAQGNFAGGNNNAGALEGDDTNPIWVTATIEFEGGVWENVGLRFKGNSSLSSTWRNGGSKFPLKLDFDQFEDEYPEIDDQRFYGFKQLSLSSNFSDNSFLREKVAADIFRESGVPAAQTAFYEVYLDYGEGSTYLGLYTMVEVVDDTLIDIQFDDDSGNVYKPEGTGATFAANSFSERSFDKETNQDEADYSDILALYDVLHSETRISDPASWRTELESVFEVDGFLHYLAINNIIQNWDTYGNMTHNYYLYNNPETGLLTWIPWDNNEALGLGKRSGTLSLSMDEVSTNWPLIRYLTDDPVYNEIYTNYLAETVAGAFNPDKMAATYQELAALISPYASAEVGEAAFNNAVQGLISHAYERADVVNTFLGK